MSPRGTSALKSEPSSLIARLTLPWTYEALVSRCYEESYLKFELASDEFAANMRANHWSATYILVEICSTHGAVSVGRRALEELGSSAAKELAFYRNCVVLAVRLAWSYGSLG